jgi:hypothetical protein
LADVENRGKLNLAEFHVAMGLIYRRLNGNPIPSSLPPEMVPPSARDLDNSVDFLKDLLKKDNSRATGEAYAKHTLGPVRSLHGARSSPNLHKDATMYKHDEVDSSSTYKSQSRHIDRRTVRHAGEDKATAKLDSSQHDPPPRVEADDKRRSVDWMGEMAADGMRLSTPNHQPSPTIHAEGSTPQQEEASQSTGPEDCTKSFGMSQSKRPI